MTLPTRLDDRDCGLVANASEKAIVGNAVPGVPSGVSRRSGTNADKFAHRGQICPTERRGRRSLRGNGKDAKRETPLSLNPKRQRRIVPLRYHSCSGKIPALVSLYRADPVLLTDFQRTARRGYPVRSRYCLAPYRQLSETWGRTDLSSSWRWGIFTWWDRSSDQTAGW